MTAGGLDNREARLTEGLKALRQRRDGSGRWRSFPFYYTLLSLTEIDIPLAVDEMKYAADVCERYLKRRATSDSLNRRRRLLMERVLEKC
ncbi:MAG: hypothetical protein JSU79_01880 [Dehalococcoidales bacterium]|nr:MAG: hypothetical protein JSU79_01880 [Dehalococcoidales bacterium]